MGSPQYCTVADLKDAVDERDLKGLTSDDGTEATLTSANSKLITAIEYASSAFLRSTLAGGKYTALQLQTLAADDDWAIKGPVVDCAIWFLYSRRQSTDTPTQITERKKSAQDIMDSLRRGDQILPIKVSTDAEIPEAIFATRGQRDRLNLVSDSEYFPDSRTSGDG